MEMPASLMKTLFLLVITTLTTLVWSAPNRLDMDIDNDGLIEINDLADLADINNHLDGTALYDSSLGCPLGGCIGFELTQHLDMDTNQDGVMDENDDYWREGNGWLPIGYSKNSAFRAIFNGNGFEIKNLYINYSSALGIALFGYTESAKIENLGITGNLVSVTGGHFVGILVGKATRSTIQNCYTHGILNGGDSVGGLIGEVKSSIVTNSYSTAEITADQFFNAYVAGLIGYADQSQITATFSTGFINAEAASSAPLVSRFDSKSSLIGSFSTSRLKRAFNPLNSSVHLVSGDIRNINNSYWASDLTGVGTYEYLNIDNSYFPVLGHELKCVTHSDATSVNTSCLEDAGITLFKEWSELGHENEAGVFIPYWDFGTSEQLPGLVINGVTHRDSDGDGAIDEYDDMPSNWYVTKDTDGDGYPDEWNNFCDDACIAESGFELDQFPNSPAAFKDADFDGFPDQWNENCSAQCLLDTDLILDGLLNDQDNDGQSNEIDNDDNSDQILDADSDSDGLIEVSTLAELNAIRFNLAGTGRVLSMGGKVDSSGCPYFFEAGQYLQKCFGYELINDLDFDTNQNGIIDGGDAYWNENEQGIGEGWLPIGAGIGSFEGNFNGNGYAIKNLYINRPTNTQVGLFLRIKNSVVSELAIIGGATKVIGKDAVGLLAGGFIELVSVNGVVLMGTVMGNKYVGGLVGRTDSWQTISNVFSSVKVNGVGGVGGISGYSENTGITNVLVVGRVEGAWDDYGIVGINYGLSDVNALKIENVHWAFDSANSNQPYFNYPNRNFVAFGLRTLQFISEANILMYQNDVLYSELYRDWPVDSAESIYWNFGSRQQLPALTLNGSMYRDSDGDGILDLMDTNRFDHDNDGVEDYYDTYPMVAIGGYVDTDNDGAPAECDDACLELGLIKDVDDAIPYEYPLGPIVGSDEEPLDVEGREVGVDGTNQGGAGVLFNLFFLILISAGFRLRVTSARVQG